ncbi:unnamed protein product [Paramecium sonneborni]|uniref:Uncharacterized protein n=1 Tax=Paramecium sonneborni TaxID=65129 RepID=A0A8S1RP07_9CILI|nr:unnamed protein product [Paramecium sonneborni]
MRFSHYRCLLSQIQAQINNYIKTLKITKKLLLASQKGIKSSKKAQNGNKKFLNFILTNIIKLEKLKECQNYRIEIMNEQYIINFNNIKIKMDIQKLIEIILDTASTQKIKQDIQIVQQVLNLSEQECEEKIIKLRGIGLKVYVLLPSPKIHYITNVLTVAKSHHMCIAKNAICQKNIKIML